MSHFIFLIVGYATFFTLGHCIGREYEIKRRNRIIEKARIKKDCADIN